MTAIRQSRAQIVGLLLPLLAAWACGTRHAPAAAPPGLPVPVWRADFTGKAHIDRIALSPDGRLLAYVHEKIAVDWTPPTVVIRDLKTGRERVVPFPAPGPGAGPIEAP